MFLPVQNQGDDSAESCAAGNSRPQPRKFRKQFGHIGLVIMTLAGVSGGVYSWSTSERFDLKSRVICKAVLAA